MPETSCECAILLLLYDLQGHLSHPFYRQLGTVLDFRDTGRVVKQWTLRHLSRYLVVEFP